MARNTIPLTVTLGAATLLTVGLALALFLQTAEEPGEPGLGARTRPAPGASRTPLEPAPEAPARPAQDGPGPRSQAPVLHPGAEQLVGRVLDDETGRPVPAFEVRIVPHDGTPAGERLEDAVPTPVKDTTGVFRLPHRAGRWDVQVSAPGYLPAELPDLRVPPDALAPPVVRLRHGPSILGRVLDESGFPARDVEVFLGRPRESDAPLPGPGRRPTAAVTRTDGDGRFRFAPLAPGDYAVSLLQPDHPLDRVAPIRVGQGATAVTLYLSPKHELTVIVRAPGGGPLDQARVTLEGGGHRFGGRANHTGQVLLRHVPDGDYVLSVECDGYRPATEELRLSGGASRMARWFTLARKAPR